VEHSKTKKVIKKEIKTNHPKTDTRYWERKVAFQTPASRTYSVQIQHARHRAWIGLGTANKAQAAFEARQLYLALKANGWDETMRRRRGDPIEKRSDVTIGEYIEAVREKSLLRPATIESYAGALREIAGAITGRKQREQRVSIKLRSITDDKIEAWRALYIRRKGVNPLAEKSARITASSLILRAKALFFADTLARVRDVIEIPDPVPFASVKAEGVPPPRYRSTFDIVALVESAREELATEHPELFKVFLLGAMAGLRRHEIDLLQWRAFLFDEGAIRIETTEHFKPKSSASEGDIHVDAELLDIFRGFRARAKSDSDFVIESGGDPAAASRAYYNYRCESKFDALCKWLRSHGVMSKKPLHTLRKEFGSQIHARYGLLAASEALRHGGVSVTARHYIENKHRSVLGFGHLLKSEARTLVPLPAKGKP
jgi:integrase